MCAAYTAIMIYYSLQNAKKTRVNETHSQKGKCMLRREARGERERKREREMKGRD
jgi:hypothetical protein